jgi:hypothetical protein
MDFVFLLSLKLFVFCEKFVSFGTGRDTGSAAVFQAFESRNRRSETHTFHQVGGFQITDSECGMIDIPGTVGIHRFDFE